MFTRPRLLLAALAIAVALPTSVLADPCGMVPPVYQGPGNPITRIGEQQTYVFFKDGVETFVIRPGFQGKVDEFGMLIPFPTPPEIRKVPDNVFGQLASAVDPPEVVIDLTPVPEVADFSGAISPTSALEFETKSEQKNFIRVLKKEAVGMYEVAVLAAGSPEALKKWMGKNGYKYPDGMDKQIYKSKSRATCNSFKSPVKVTKLPWSNLCLFAFTIS